jgi:hypothetical protein
MPILLGLIVPLYGQIQLEQLIIEEDVDQRPNGRGGAVVEAPHENDHGTGTVLKEDRLTFINDDTLQGSLHSILGGESITWVSPAAKAPIEFSPETVLSVKLKGPFATNEISSLPSIRLTNGDTYRGKIVKMDAENLILETPYAGEIQLKTPMVDSISPTSETGSVYEGPKSIEEWEVDNNGNNQESWTYSKEALYYKGNSNASVGLDLEGLPDMARIEFEVAWKGNLQLYTLLWADKTKNSRNNYTIMMQHSYIRAYRYSNDQGQLDLGNAQMNEMRTWDKAKIQFFLNRKEKEIYLFMNGQLVKKWVDAQQENEITGNALQFRASGNTTTRIKGITVRVWDGKLESKKSGEMGELDILLLKNGDSFSGTLLGIESDVVNFKTDFAELPIPIKRISDINRGKTNRAEPRKRSGDVVLTFPTDEKVTLDLAKWSQGQIQGSSETTGDVTIQTRFISQIQFNPYDEKIAEKSSDW